MEEFSGAEPHAGADSQPLRVEILTIGNELLLGFTIDSNSAYLSRSLAEAGIEVTRQTSVGDDPRVIAEAIKSALDRTGAVITSGGLGPTSDDVTRDAVALAFGTPLEEDPALLQQLDALLRGRGNNSGLSSTNRRQALRPRGAVALHNRHGTAPGLWIEDARGRWAAVLPGVPRELRGVFSDEVYPRLKALTRPGIVLSSRTIRTTGIAESALAKRIEESGRHFQELAYLPGAEGVDLRVTVRGVSKDRARQLLDADIAALREIAGATVYAEDAEDIAAVVLRLAREKGLSIAVAESCTGGMLGSRITEIPGASDVFLGGVIAYENRVKVEVLGVPEDVLLSNGAVSEAVVRAMAAGVRRLLGAAVGMAVSGVAGPSGGSPEKPVGTVWVCSDVQGESRVEMRVLPGDRDEVRRRAAQMLLNLTRIQLQTGNEPA